MTFLSRQSLFWGSLLMLMTGCNSPQPDAQATPAATAPMGTPTPSTPAANPMANTPAAASDGAVSKTVKASDFILPGALTSDMGVDDLRRIYGNANVRTGEFPGAEGQLYKGVELFAGDPTRRAIVTFEDSSKLARITSVRVDDADSKWSLNNGVRIGMPLAELQSLNGGTVRFLGFDWDYGGHVVGWKGGKLEPGAGSQITYSVQLAHDATAKSTDYPAGDGEFDSSDGRWPRLGKVVHVSSIGIAFPARDDL